MRYWIQMHINKEHQQRFFCLVGFFCFEQNTGYVNILHIPCSAPKTRELGRKTHRSRRGSGSGAVVEGIDRQSHYRP